MVRNDFCIHIHNYFYRLHFFLIGQQDDDSQESIQITMAVHNTTLYCSGKEDRIFDCGHDSSQPTCEQYARVICTLG